MHYYRTDFRTQYVLSGNFHRRPILRQNVGARIDFVIGHRFARILHYPDMFAAQLPRFIDAAAMRYHFHLMDNIPAIIGNLHLFVLRIETAL